MKSKHRSYLFCMKMKEPENFVKMSTCKRDVEVRDRDETETFEKYVSRPSRDRDVETETTTLPATRHK